MSTAFAPRTDALPKQRQATVHAPEVRIHTEEEQIVPDFGERIRRNIQELLQMAQFENVSNHRIFRLIHDSGDAYTAARSHGGEAFDDARQAYDGIWPASLQANFALAIDSLERLEDIDYESIRQDPSARNVEPHKYNNALADAVAATCRLSCGKHVITYNHEQMRERIVGHMRKVLEATPKHRFPDSVHVPSLLKDNES